MRKIGIFAFSIPVLASALFWWSSGPAHSDPQWVDSEVEVIAGDVSAEELFEARVEVIAMSCAACHGTDGRLRTAIPAIAGRPEALLNLQLQSFKQDRVPGATVMPRIARAYSEEELQGLAAYFAALDP